MAFSPTVRVVFDPSKGLYQEPGPSELIFVSGSTIDLGANATYSPSNPSDWSAIPADLIQAIDYLAAGSGSGGGGGALPGGSNGQIQYRIDATTFGGVNKLNFVGGNLAGTGSFNGVFSGSLTKLEDGSNYLLAGPNVTLTTGSNGAVTIAASSGLGPTNKIHYVVQDGNYATIQAAIDAAADWDVILVGPKAAGDSWGPAVFSPGKRLVVTSLLSKWSTQVRVDSITFNANSGLNILLNTVYVRGLFINSSFTALAPGVNFYGSAPARLRLQECFIYNNNSATGTAVISNNSGAGSSLYLDNTIVQSGWSTGIGVDHQQGYTNIRGDSEISRYQYPLQCTAGFVEILNTLLDGSGIANEVIRISGGTVTCGYSIIKNTTTNSSGVNLTTGGATFGMGDATFAIATGTGYCVNGPADVTLTAVFLYGPITYSNSAAAAFNVKVKSTITALPTTQTFTLA